MCLSTSPDASASSPKKRPGPHVPADLRTSVRGSAVQPPTTPTFGMLSASRRSQPSQRQAHAPIDAFRLHAWTCQDPRPPNDWPTLTHAGTVTTPERKKRGIALGWQDVCDLRQRTSIREATDDTDSGGPAERQMGYHPPFGICPREAEHS